jgi:hypothetical protein
MSAADLAAVVGNGNNGGFGFGGECWWIILLFLVLFGNGGWGNGYGNGNGGAGGLYPWMNQAEITSDGFRDQMLNSNITGIRDGINSLSTQLCNCCSDMQMATMNQTFGLQNAINQGFNATQAQLANCCCENRLASADLKYTIATENCADRAALSDGIRDVIASQTASTQKILDKLCEQEIQAKDDLIGQLRQEVLFARGQASQIAQNQTIVDNIYNRLDTCPVGTTPVYGRTPIFSCNQNSGCGCGCGNGF